MLASNPSNQLESEKSPKRNPLESIKCHPALML
jgi:hypothetical protein